MVAAPKKKKRKRDTLAEKEQKAAREGGKGKYGRSDMSMRKLAIRLSEQGKNTPSILESLRQTFPNTKLPGKRAIQKWIQNKEQIVAHAESGDAQMRKRTSPAAQRDAILHEQLKDYEAVGSLISDHVIQEHAKNIVQQKGKEALGLNKDRESNNDLNFGYTWLKTFKETYGWQRRMTHGEAGAADQVGIESAQRVLPQYDADDIYNADETALM